MHTKIVIPCERVKFYSREDEDLFFEWIKQIPCIRHVSGERDVMYLHMTHKKTTKHELKTLVALFRRYNINLKVLDILINSKNRAFFESIKKCYSINMYPAKSGD